MGWRQIFSVVKSLQSVGFVWAVKAAEGMTTKYVTTLLRHIDVHL
jgi:hypothetical protein